MKNCHEPIQTQRKFFKRKHILLRNTNGWTLQNQANSPTACATFAVGAELPCPPAEAQHVVFLLPQLVGKPEQSEFPCYVPPMKGNASWGLQLQAQKHAVKEVTTAIRKTWFPTTGPKEETMPRCRLPTAMKKLHRTMWVQLQAKSFRAIKKAKSAIKAKRGEGKRKREKQYDTYPQSIQLIVPRPFTSWATLDSNLSELSAAAAGKKKLKKKSTTALLLHLEKHNCAFLCSEALEEHFV